MATESVFKILAGYRITIPNKIRKKLKLDLGDFVILRLEDESFRVIPAEVDVHPRHSKFERVDANKNLTVSHL